MFFGTTIVGATTRGTRIVGAAMGLATIVGTITGGAAMGGSNTCFSFGIVFGVNIGATINLCFIFAVVNIYLFKRVNISLFCIKLNMLFI